MRNISIAAACAALLAAPASAATVYKCKDQQGELHYQGTPCTSTDQAVGSWQAHSDAALVPEAEGAGNTIVIGQGRGGHYFVDGSINDQYVNFLVDTGATTVAIPLNLASAAGLRCEAMSAMQTANGVTRTCTATIQKLMFGKFTLKYVDAMVVPNLGQPLLGMNVLRRFHVEQDGGQLRISRKY